MVLELLQDMLVNGHLIAAEHKAAVAIIKQLETDECEENNKELRLILNPTQVKKRKKKFFCFLFFIKFFRNFIKPSIATFEQIAVSDFAEQMTLIDHKLFCALDSE